MKPAHFLFSHPSRYGRQVAHGVRLDGVDDVDAVVQLDQVAVESQPVVPGRLHAEFDAARLHAQVIQGLQELHEPFLTVVDEHLPDDIAGVIGQA